MALDKSSSSWHHMPLKASGGLEYPNPTRKRAAVPRLRVGLRLVLFNLSFDVVSGIVVSKPNSGVVKCQILRVPKSAIASPSSAEHVIVLQSRS